MQRAMSRSLGSFLIVSAATLISVGCSDKQKPSDNANTTSMSANTAHVSAVSGGDAATTQPASTQNTVERHEKGTETHVGDPKIIVE